MQNFAFKFQAVAEKTAKDVRGPLYFAAPCRNTAVMMKHVNTAHSCQFMLKFCDCLLAPLMTDKEPDHDDAVLLCSIGVGSTKYS